jgi:hypothetical protein
MVKQVKLWKLNFFKNTDKLGGAMANAISICQEDEIVIHSQTKTNGRIWGATTPKKFLDLLVKNYGLYEVITRFPHKVYFDIDKLGKQEPSFLQDTIKPIIVKYFPDAVMAISGSIKETKTSYHIVLQNYVIHNEDERQHMKHLNKYLCKSEESFDWKVYTKNRNMKCINQSKDDGRVQEIIENNDFKAHCITCFVPDYSLPFQPLPENIKEFVMIEKAHKSFDIGMLPKMILQTPDNFDSTTATPEEILALIPLDKSFDHNYTHLVARYCYYHSISFEMFLAWLQKKHHSLTTDITGKWKTHWNNIIKFPKVENERMITILQNFYPHINKDIHFRKFSETFNLPSEIIQKIETITYSDFTNKSKYNIFNVGMGGGKTHQAINYLSGQSNFLWIAPNKALATNTKKRFEDAYVDVNHYEEFNTQKKKAGALKEVDRLIICLNSIHYLDETTFEVLIIDEIETLIDKFLGDFLEQGKLQLKSKIWQSFVRLFKMAKKVILLDAFITSKTIKMIEAIEGYSLSKVSDAIIFERMNEPQTRTIKYMDNHQTMIKDIIMKLNQGLKLFIFYPYKRIIGNGMFASMEQVYEAIKSETGKDGIFYNADVSDGVKQGLKDVNESWGDQHFIITNNIITCGVNYENLDFDYKYLFIASHNTPRDIIQVSYRARHLNTGIIKICYMGKMNQSNTWLNDCDHIRCPIYNKVFKEILIEKKAPIKRAFQLFCVKAHYKQTTDDFKINETVEKEMKELLEKQKVGMSYASIPEIDWSYAEIIESKCFAQQATMMDKYSLNKYYFQKSFIDAKDEKLEDIWDDNFAFFFKRLSPILLDKNNLFNKIAEHNKLPSLFPVDIKKTKLNDEIKEQIFKDFSFKFITSGSASNKILKEIYNTYFSKAVVKTFYEETKNANYVVHINVCEYYEFAKANLILDTATYLTYNKLSQEDDDNSIEI